MRTRNTAIPLPEAAVRYSSSVTHHRGLMGSSKQGAAISELARRTLRSGGVTVRTKGVERLRIDSLSVLISDLVPSVISGAIAEETGEGAIAIVLEGEPGGFIGGSEPRTLDGVWIPGNPDELWKEFENSVLGLAAAGYPGCIGCAGPAAELPWDEEASRDCLR